MVLTFEKKRAFWGVKICKAQIFLVPLHLEKGMTL